MNTIILQFFIIYLLISKFAGSMANTRDEILLLAEAMIRKKGYNAFNYRDISQPLNIKNAAVHYYFPKKSDLAVAIFRSAQERFDLLWTKHTKSNSIDKLKAFIKTYADSSERDMVCLVGAMATEFYSLEKPVQDELKLIVDDIGHKLTEILKEGKRNKEFHFPESPHTRALMIITNLLAGLQLARINGKQSFELLKNNIIKSIS